MNTHTAPRPLGWLLASLSLGMLLPSLGTSIANVALPTFTQAFGAPFQQVQWVVLAYLLATTTLVVGAGRLGDLVGRRRLFLGGLVLFTVASLLCAVAPTLGWLVAARALQGAGAAVLMALTMAFVGASVPKDRNGRAMGLLGTMSAVGTALGPSLGGVLIAGFGWRSIFVLNLPLGLVALWLAWRNLPADGPRRAATRFDGLGTLLLAVTLAAYALAMTLGRGRMLPWLVAVVVGAVLFVAVERRSASPLVRLASLREPVLSAGLAMSALVSAVVMASLVVGPFYLAAAFGLGAALVGATLSAGPVVSALVGVPAGRLVDGWGAVRVTRVGLLAMLSACLALGWVPAAWGVAGYVLPLVLLTTGYALFQAANNTAVMADVAPDQRGVVSGLLNLSRNLGLITGASAMGAVFAWGAGTADLHAASADAVAAGLRATFTGAAALVGVALGVALLAWWRVVPALHHKPGSDDSAPGPSFLAFPSSARREPACVTTTTPATVSTPTTPTGRC